MITPAVLLKDLKRLVRTLEDDIRDSLPGSEADAQLQRQWQAARDAGRTAATYESWREEEITQSAVHWVLGGVFLRFIEDNGLVERPWLAGPTPERMALARDRYEGYFRAHPHESDRDFLLACFTEAGRLHGAAALFDTRHNPVWELPISGDGGIALMTFWTKADPDNGRLVHDFSDPDLSTRFLGDLYQDLSEAARKRYALLQTPEFVEEFILDRTLTPAIQEFGFREVRLIDPTCGSGHFLLGAFHRLVSEWNRAEPGRNIRDVAQRALDAVAGVDINPFAIAIARFRLLVAALKVCGIARLANAPNFEFRLATGDSLLHGKRFMAVRGAQLSLDPQEGVTHYFHCEDRDELDQLLGHQYEVVVGNPPYIQVQDDEINRAYRERYASCHKRYALSVPFFERFFDIAVNGDRPGFVGFITANSFMTREFGKKLVEKFIPHTDVTDVIDTSRCQLPGHDTSTVIIFGRNCHPQSSFIRVIANIKGAGAADNPAEAPVWTRIMQFSLMAGHEDEYISVQDIKRTQLKTHPWVLGAEANVALVDVINGERNTLADNGADIGRTTHTGEDGAFYFFPDLARRMGAKNFVMPTIIGEDIREYLMSSSLLTAFPYDSDGNALRHPPEELKKYFWPNRTILRDRVDYGEYIEQRGLSWFEQSMFFPDRFKSVPGLCYGEIATHNHFLIYRQRAVFNRTAPIVRTKTPQTIDLYQGWLGELSSAVACYWLKQCCTPKGGDRVAGEGGGRSLKSRWEERYVFNATKLARFPLAEPYPLDLARELDSLAQQLTATLPPALLTNAVPPRAELDAARDRALSIRHRMIALQEELDWRCYKLYGVVDGAEAEGLEFGLEAPEVDLGQRAFEIVMARQMAAGELETTWFARHGAAPVTDIPDHWPQAYRAVVERRIALIESHRYIGLVEKPEYKRRWQWSDHGFAAGWVMRERDALERWLLDRLEDGRYWQGDPALKSVNVLADLARGDDDFCRAAALYEGQDHPDLATLVARLVARDSVPFLPVLRYSESGRRKRAQWERVWDLQRREDAGEDVGTIDVPPKYKKEDFLGTDFWRLRGGLDVPQERFISYPGAEKSADGGLMVAWAGFDHLAQARAVAGFYHEMKDVEGWEKPRLLPLLAGLTELIPWLKQWHNAYDADFGQGPGDWFAAFLAEEARTLGVIADDIATWEPAAKVKAKRGKKAKVSELTLEDLGL